MRVGLLKKGRVYRQKGPSNELFHYQGRAGKFYHFYTHIGEDETYLTGRQVNALIDGMTVSHRWQKCSCRDRGEFK